MSDIASLDGKRISVEEAKIHALSSAAAFGNKAFERMRGFYDSNGNLRIRALSQQIERGFKSATTLFAKDLPEELKTLWRTWIIEAVKASEIQEPYIHLGFGQFSRPGAMLERSHGGFSTFIFVNEAPPLYGDYVILSSEREWPRPNGPLVACKASGHYLDLLHFKNRARERMSDKEPKHVEALLFDGATFSSEDPNVAELGCSNAFAINSAGQLLIPYRHIPYFRGISVQIVEHLFRLMCPGISVLPQLRRSDLYANGGAIGTATSHIVPIVQVDNKACTHDEPFWQLANEYINLCRGESSFPELQNKWAPVTE